MMTSRLQRSIHNQIEVTSGHNDESLFTAAGEKYMSRRLNLRKYNLLSALPEVLVRCRPHAISITHLDISFSIVESHILSSLCENLANLRILEARSCGLCEEFGTLLWPNKLEQLDLSRNKLKECPQGIDQLMYLSRLNLSGNKISFMSPSLLRIPSLQKCLLLNNPLCNIPKHICRKGVDKMRQFFTIEPLPMPLKTEAELNTGNTGTNLKENCSNFRRHILSYQGSFESGYDSNQRPSSSYSTSSVSIEMGSSDSSDIECDIPLPPLWRQKFNSSELPGYRETRENQLCQVYIPVNCLTEVEIHEVRDMSLHPKLKDNELLITPVVRITPHGLTFSSKPAIIVLPHCTKNSKMNLIPMCSNTREYQTTEWQAINPCSKCEIFEDCIVFSTFHFSLFSVIASFSYPSSTMEVRSNTGGELLIPELPGFSVHVPNNSVSRLREAVTVKGTVYYCDKSYRFSDNLASACIGLEPHGMEFDNPVQVTIPIPDSMEIKSYFPNATLELWCSQECTKDAEIPTNWEHMKNINICLEESKVAKFSINHFSFFEIIWNIFTSPLQKLGLGAAHFYSQLASRSRFISVRFQAFMSYPRGNFNTFGLAVTVYKFGDPLTAPSNYPLLVADSGTKRLHFLVGDLHVRVEGCFVANEDVSETLKRQGKIVDFTSEDFCERFEFILNVKSDALFPLQEGQVLGKLHFIQWEELHPIHKSFNLIMPSTTPAVGTQTDILAETALIANFSRFQSYLTPPRSPEPENPVSHTPSIPSNAPTDRPWLRKRRRKDNTDYTPKRRILMCDSEITDRDLMSISQKCGSKYVELGISLGLDYQTVMNRTGRHEGKSEHMKAFEVLQEWKGRGFSYEALIHALEEIGLHGVALRYCYTTENSHSLT